MCEKKNETALRNQQLELRLKQAQMILQDDVDSMYGKNDITPLLTSKSLQQLEASKLTNLKNKEINPKSNYPKNFLHDAIKNTQSSFVTEKPSRCRQELTSSQMSN